MRDLAFLPNLCYCASHSLYAQSSALQVLSLVFAPRFLASRALPTPFALQARTGKGPALPLRRALLTPFT